MSKLKLTGSIFDTSTDEYDGWDFSGTNIVKDNVATNNNSNIIDTSNSTALKPTNTTKNSFIDSMASWWGGETPPPPKIETDTGMFSGANIGSTLKGGGAVVGALSSIFGTLEQTKFNKQALNMEKDRINRNNEREDKLQKNYEGVWS